VQYLRQQGFTASGMPEMRVLPGEAGNCSGCKSIITTHRGEIKMDELFEKMKKLIADKLEVDEGKITLDASFRQDLGADSLDTYELVYAIEEEMGISIPDEKANEFETVRDAYEFIKSQK
jgi:acyl carrier protein